MKISSVGLGIASLLALVTLLGVARPLLAQPKTSKDSIVITPNTNPILEDGLIDGFTLKGSQLVRDNPPGKDPDLIIELWQRLDAKPQLQPAVLAETSNPSDDFERLKAKLGQASNHSRFTISLYNMKDQPDALVFAKTHFYATPGSQSVVIGKPSFGSFSGQPIGDYCWAYTAKFPHEIPDDLATLLVVKGHYLFRVQAGVTSQSRAMAEKVANVVASRLSNWAWPQ